MLLSFMFTFKGNQKKVLLNNIFQKCIENYSMLVIIKKKNRIHLMLSYYTLFPLYHTKCVLLNLISSL